MNRMNMDPSNKNSESIAAQMAALSGQLEKLNAQRYIRIQNSWPRLIAYYFVRGLATGLGTVVGATLLVSVLLYFLSQIDYIPIIGEWASEIADQISRR